jgi:hypothetical protein
MIVGLGEVRVLTTLVRLGGCEVRCQRLLRFCTPTMWLAKTSVETTQSSFGCSLGAHWFVKLFASLGPNDCGLPSPSKQSKASAVIK